MIAGSLPFLDNIEQTSGTAGSDWSPSKTTSTTSIVLLSSYLPVGRPLPIFPGKVIGQRASWIKGRPGNTTEKRRRCKDNDPTSNPPMTELAARQHASLPRVGVSWGVGDDKVVAEATSRSQLNTAKGISIRLQIVGPRLLGSTTLPDRAPPRRNPPSNRPNTQIREADPRNGEVAGVHSCGSPNCPALASLKQDSICCGATAGVIQVARPTPLARRQGRCMGGRWAGMRYTRMELQELYKAQR